MTNRTKIIIVILLILAIVIGIVGITNNNKKNTEVKKKNSFDYVNTIDTQLNEADEAVENEEVQNEIIESQEENQNVVEADNQTNYIGREEQESNDANTELDDRNQAIDLAKKEWAISVDSYDFQAELKEEKVYAVSVINKVDRNVITIYNVDLKTGTVTE